MKERLVTFISSEVEEMLRTCSRMAVLRDGKKVGEIDGDDLTSGIHHESHCGR